MAPSCAQLSEGAMQNTTGQFQNTLQKAHFEPVFTPLLRVLRRESGLALYFGGEEDALPFAVWGGDGLQLEEVQQHLDLHGEQELQRHTKSF